MSCIQNIDLHHSLSAAHHSVHVRGFGQIPNGIKCIGPMRENRGQGNASGKFREKKEDTNN